MVNIRLSSFQASLSVLIFYVVPPVLVQPIYWYQIHLLFYKENM